MKEKDFLDYISTIDTDSSMDQKILKQVFDNDGATNKNNNILRNTNIMSYFKERFQLMHTLSKVTTALIIIAIVGTATAFASGHLVKVIIPKITYTEPEGSPVNIAYTDKTYIKGSEPIIDELERIIGYNRIPGAAEEAFALIDLPNLVPTYLLENYYTDSDGYVYTHKLSDDGFVFKDLRAFFTSDAQFTKEVFFWFVPEEDSVKDAEFNYSNLKYKDFTQTTYITKSGLLCTIEDYNVDNHYLNVYILFESDELGNGLYRLEFSPNMEIEEVEEILDSIPLNGNGELITN